MYNYGEKVSLKQRKRPKKGPPPRTFNPTLRYNVVPGETIVVETKIADTPDTYQLILTLRRPDRTRPFRYRVKGADPLNRFAASDQIDDRPIVYDRNRLTIPNAYQFTLERVDMEYLHHDEQSPSVAFVGWSQFLNFACFFSSFLMFSSSLGTTCVFGSTQCGCGYRETFLR